MIGVVLLNLGTPDAPREAEVRNYLREFLMDPLVIDIPGLFRWMFVHGIILRKRPAASAEAYKKVWTDRGSPLLFHTVDLGDRVKELLSGKAQVEIAMRYGNPSIAGALQSLAKKGVTRLIVMPLYPQFSSAATESSILAVKAELKKMNWDVAVEFQPEFYSDPAFISAFSAQARPILGAEPFDHLLFSFHGLPERQVKKTDHTGSHCLVAHECSQQVTDGNQKCYRAQSYATARLIAQDLALPESKYSVGFQSRLGRTEWIKPYTDHLYVELAKKGVKRLVVMSPSFVADCLETLEEIEMRGREQFIAAGGEDLVLVPSLNSSPLWAEAIAGWVIGA